MNKRIMNNWMLRLTVISTLSLLSLGVSASSLKVQLANNKNNLEISVEAYQMDTWQATQKGDCTYYSKVTEHYSDQDRKYNSGYLLQARLSCVYSEQNSDYYYLPELFLTTDGKAAVSFGDDDSVTFHYEASLS